MPGNPLLRGKKTRSNNAAGHNGSDNGNWPEDKVLKAALLDFVTQQLPIKHRLLRLCEDHGLDIKTTTLHALNKHFKIPSVRCWLPQEKADQLVLNKMSDLNDRERRWGVERTRAALARDGTPVARRIIREVMQYNEPEEVDTRYPGKKKILRATLTAIGPFHEVNCNGHDKLGALALKMGPVGIPIYGMKDKWSSAILRLVVVPNNRLATTIGHVYLDFVEEFGAIPVQITVDKGSETGDMYSFQTGLRNAYAPDLDDAEYPSFVVLRSVHNTTIEGAWHWFREQTGRTLVHHITKARDTGIFNPNNQIHVLNRHHRNLFNWLWPPVVQRELNNHRDSWNKHQIRPQKDKAMPSGSTPTMFFRSPESFGGKRVPVDVPNTAVQALRDTLAMSREEAVWWVDDDFAVAAGNAHAILGCPPIDLGTAWAVFIQMVPLLNNYM
ncbi:hypothetical protein B0H21DRAFT_779612 [Amylocystis lapponica]|nr:hypothetical protein B0H21DRAFT_779612 [Amylocystis lapponica]